MGCAPNHYRPTRSTNSLEYDHTDQSDNSDMDPLRPPIPAIVTTSFQQHEEHQLTLNDELRRSNISLDSTNTNAATSTLKAAATTTTAYSTTQGGGKLFFKCHFKRCNQRVWFPGYESMEEYHMHMHFHRCQWLYAEHDFKPCLYYPKDESDLKSHLAHHISNDLIPNGRYEYLNIFISNTSGSSHCYN
jgi:hypothetical protein